MLNNFSCVNEAYLAPYVISRPEFIIGEVDSFFMYGGILLDFCNSAEKEIEHIELSFSLYDTQTQESPLFGTNHIVTTYDQHISPDEEMELCISLDEYLYTIPSEVFAIKNFCVTKIIYTDGSRWTDVFCCHAVDSQKKD